MTALDLTSLLSRVEASTGADRELFDDAAGALVGCTSADDPFWDTFSDFIAVGAWTDAALALCERVLPGQWIELSGPRKYLNIPSPVPNYWRAECGSIGWGATPALALLAAMLKALIAQQEQPHG